MDKAGGLSAFEEHAAQSHSQAADPKKSHENAATKSNKGSKLPVAKATSDPMIEKQSEKAKLIPADQQLLAYLDNASPAQKSQIEMIKRIFTIMDGDGDGILTLSDVRAYFRSIGRNASDLEVRKWIKDRDVDQDGAVSLVEFVSSFAPQLDISNRFSGAHGSSSAPFDASHLSPVAVAFGALRLGNSPGEVWDCCSAAQDYVRKVLDSPSVPTFWRIPTSDAQFTKKVGRLFGGTKLMNSLGFLPEENGNVIALRDPNGKRWDSVPNDVRQKLMSRLAELSSHKNSLTEPSISNVSAGWFLLN